MNTFTIVLSGVLLFVRAGADVNDARRVIAPKITGLRYHDRRIGDHIAYIAVKKDLVDSSAWGSQPNETRLIGGALHHLFYLNGEELTINAAPDSSLDATQHQSFVPRITEWCPGFALNSDFPRSATLDIDRGVLTASGNINNDEPVVSKLTVKTEGALIISVRSSTRKLTIQPGASVRFENEAASRDHNHDHFLTYYAMSRDQTCDGRRVPGPPRARRPRARRDRNPGADCSNSQYP